MHAAPAISSSLNTLPLDLIDTDPQIRTRNGFDDESIRQLADSIQHNGLLQPILVRAIGDRYTVIAGHRRLAALRFAGFTVTPATVATADDEEKAFEAQLAENIQREALTLADTADAVRMLARIHTTPAAVGAIVHKSKAWVSKHMAITADRFNPNVRALLDAGQCEDLETLITLDQILRLEGGHIVYDRLVALLSAGHSVRAIARDSLAKMKKPTIPAEPSSADQDGADDDEGGPVEKFGKIELAQVAAAKILAALKYAQANKPSSRPGEELIAYFDDFIRKTWRE